MWDVLALRERVRSIHGTNMPRKVKFPPVTRPCKPVP